MLQSPESLLHHSPAISSFAIVTGYLNPKAAAEILRLIVLLRTTAS